MAKSLYLRGVELSDTEEERVRNGDRSLVDTLPTELIPVTPGELSIPGGNENALYSVGTIAKLDETPIGSGVGIITMWSMDIPADRVIEVRAKFSSTANDVSSGLRLFGELACIAHRYGSGALAIDAQNAGMPWALTSSAWAPFFDVNGNTLRLRIYQDATCQIVPRCKVAYELTDTSGDPAPVVNIWDALLAGLQVDLNGKIVGFYAGPDIVEESPGVLGNWPGRVGSTLANSTANRFSTVTFAGVRARGPGSLGQAKSLDAASAVSFASTWLISVGHTNAGVDAYEEACGSTTSSLASLVRGNLLQSWEPPGTFYTDGVESTAIPTSGTHVFEVVSAAPAVEKLRVGGHSAVARVWSQPIPLVFQLSTGATSGERAAGYARLKAFEGNLFGLP